MTKGEEEEEKEEKKTKKKYRNNKKEEEEEEWDGHKVWDEKEETKMFEEKISW